MPKANEIQYEELDGVRYGFRTPTLYDPARARRILTRQGIRYPSLVELQMAARHGIVRVAETAGDVAEGERQAEILERFHEAIKPVDENAIDEPDPIRRGETYAKAEEERSRILTELYPEVRAIEAVLERHWPPYAELLADKNFYDDVSRIEMVRLLLVSQDGVDLPRDEEDMLTQSGYQMLPKAHRVPLSSIAFRLIAPDEARTKN